MRKSISKPTSQAKPSDKKPPPDFDMAEQMNEQISNKYVKGPSSHATLADRG